MKKSRIETIRFKSNIRFSIVLLLFCILHSTFYIPSSSARQDTPTEAEEYALKAAFLYNFTKYIEWPSSGPNDKEFIIGVVGSSPILSPLLEIAKNKTVKGRKIIIQQFAKVSDVTFTHVLFVAQRQSSSIPYILSTVTKGTLIVAETEGAGEDGVDLNFVIVNNKLRFEANTKALSMAGFKASSELLKLAIIN